MSDPSDDGAKPAASGSILAGLRARREAAAKKLHLDLRVPRIDPPVYVRYRPIPQSVLDLVNTKLAASKDADKVVIANAAALSHACVGVFGMVDGKPEGNPDTWPKFDANLAAELGLPDGTGATDIVRALYLTDGDVIAAATELADWSGTSERRVDEETEGN